MPNRQLLWEPSKERIAAARMSAYLDWLTRERQLRFTGYGELWRWSVDDLDGFWRSIWDYYDVVSSAAPTALLATASVGAVWSCCAPDFGTKGVIDRFQQIAPTVLIAVDGYRFGGKDIDRADTVAELRRQLPTVRNT